MKSNSNSLVKELILNRCRSKREEEYFFNNSYKNIYLRTKDNIKIGAALYEPQKISEETKYVILCHGSGSNRDDFSEIGETQCFSSYSNVLLILDYREFGDSEGEFVRDRINLDLLSCFDYLIESYNPKEVSLIGYSLGTGIVSEYLKYIEMYKRYLLTCRESDTAILQPTEYHKDSIIYPDRYDERYVPSKIFLIAPFTSLKNLVEESYVFSILSKIFPSFSSTIEELKYDNLENLRYYFNGKIFIYHGCYDKIISYKHSVNLKKTLNCYLKVLESDHLRILLSESMWKDIYRILRNDDNIDEIY